MPEMTNVMPKEGQVEGGYGIVRFKNSFVDVDL
jgi:hypothetical protein